MLPLQPIPKLPKRTHPDHSAHGTTADTRQSGLTKREYFAAQMLVAFLANNDGESAEMLAEQAVKAADSLIAQLNSQPFEEKSDV